MKVSVRDDGSGVTDWVAFDLGGNNVLNCTIGIVFGSGGNVTMLENTECRNITDDSGMINIYVKVNLNCDCKGVIFKKCLSMTNPKVAPHPHLTPP